MFLFAPNPTDKAYALFTINGTRDTSAFVYALSWIAILFTPDSTDTDSFVYYPTALARIFFSQKKDMQFTAFSVFTEKLMPPFLLKSRHTAHLLPILKTIKKQFN